MAFLKQKNKLKISVRTVSISITLLPYTVDVRTHARSVSKNVISEKYIVGESVNSNCITHKTQEYFALSHIPVLTAAIFPEENLTRDLHVASIITTTHLRAHTPFEARYSRSTSRQQL